MKNMDMGIVFGLMGRDMLGILRMGKLMDRGSLIMLMVTFTMENGETALLTEEANILIITVQFT